MSWPGSHFFESNAALASEEFLDFEALSVYLSGLKQAKEDYDIDKIKKIFQQTVDGYK